MVTASTVALVAGAVPLNGPASVIRIVPAGTFRTMDGRPKDLAGWHLGPREAARIIAVAEQRPEDLVIDYEHATLRNESTGPVPAAGWIKRLEWQDGDGLHAHAEWTGRAWEMIAAREYRYISPVLAYDKSSGAVTQLLGAGLTNTPALAGLTDLSQLAAARFERLVPVYQVTFEPGTKHRAQEMFRRVFGMEVDA